MKTELQVLQKEINDLRTEMISLHKELLANQKLLIRIINSPGINISLNNFFLISIFFCPFCIKPRIVAYASHF